MGQLFYYEEHISCNHYISDIRVGFKYMELKAGTELVNEESSINYLVFILEGRIEIHYNQHSDNFFHAGELFLIPYLSIMSGKALTDVSLIVCHFMKPPNLCDKTELQSLSSLCADSVFSFQSLDIRPIMNNFLILLKSYLQDGASCMHLHEIKHKEMFLLFRFYYSKEELANLFHPIIGQSFDFREKVILSYNRHSKVQQLADYCGYSMTTFTEKFKAEFNSSPLEWIQKQKAPYIQSMIADISVPIKEIVDEFQFTSQTHLNTYCKKFFGLTAVQLRAKLISENAKVAKKQTSVKI